MEQALILAMEDAADETLSSTETFKEAMQLSLPRPPAASSFPPHFPMSEEIENLIVCPITLELMRDPVMIVQSDQTCDRESLCRWLIGNPSQCPVTGKNYGEKLEYRDNLVARKLLMHFVGDEAYQRYDDSDFQRQYEAFWKEPDRKSGSTILPDERKINLPTSTIGISFSGTPPTITKIADSSIFRGESRALIGMAIDTLVLPGGPTYMELCTKDLGKLLGDSSDISGRQLTLKNPATRAMSKKPDEVEVKLPSGSLGVIFKGTPPKVVRFFRDSPVRISCQWVLSLILLL